jgi:pectin methylesterase-like acyl-CoA thioesterase
MKRISWAAIAVAVGIMSFSALSPFSPRASAGSTWVVDDDGLGSVSDCDSADTAYSTIQAAIDAAAADDTILVCPGTYDQDEANGRDPNTGGSGSNDFNIFVGKALTIRGVDASGTPINDYNDVAAFVEAKRKLPTFGESTIFVQADGVTITGLDVTGWLDGDYNNKTLEVVGDGFTLRDCALHALDTASSLYFDDRHFNAGTMTSHVQSYDVEENLLDGGGPDADGIRISSGAGWSGPVSGRVIAGNTFDNTIDGVAFVGPGGDPWDVYPVGAATITGNSFSRSDRRHVVAWGSYAGGPGYGDIDWQGIVDNNTFDKGAVTWTPGGDARAWTSGSFINVRGIYSAIQRYALAKAEAGDTVQVLPGLYPETLNIEGRSDISIVGDDRDTVVVKPTSTLPWNVGGYGTARQAAVRVVGSTGIDLSNMTFDFNTVKGNNVAGLFYWDSTGVISGNALKNMTASDAAGFYGELTSYVRAPSYSDGARAEVEFNCNVFTETGRLGIVTHDFVHATIQGNTFTKTINDFGYAMEIGSRSTATVTGNTISGYDTPAASDGSTAAGIYIENSFTGGLPHIVKPVTVSGNTITGNQYGVWIGNEYTGYAGDIDINVTLQGNAISDNTDGGLYIVDEGRSAGSSVTVSASGNDVKNNGDVGYWFNTYGDGELHVDVMDDTITGHDYGVIMTDYPSGTSNSLYDVSVNLGDLSGNTVGAENDVVSQTLDALSNWWGDVTGPHHPTKNPFGLGGEVSDYVLFDPWLKGIEYVGDTRVPSGSAANLRARYLNSDGSSPAVAGATINFDLVDSNSVPVAGSPFPVVTDGTGVASVPVPGLGIDLYTITARWDPLQGSAQLTVFGPNDWDGDGVTDGWDNCQMVFNPSQLNSDGARRPNGSQLPGEWASNPALDHMGDACDLDDDNDAMPDSSESESTCPFRLNGDSDGDRSIDGYEGSQGKNACSAASKPACISGTDSDADGFTDCVENGGYNTCAFAGDTFPGWTTCANPLDSDFDGCADWIEIVDVNGNRSADILDVQAITRRAFGLIPASDSDTVLDIDKNGSVNLIDAMLAAKNSALVKTHDACYGE